MSSGGRPNRQYQQSGNGRQHQAQSVNVNLYGQSGMSRSPWGAGGAAHEEEEMHRMQEHELDYAGVAHENSHMSGGEVHWIVFAVIAIIIILVVLAVLYFTKAFGSSQTIYGDTATCCTASTKSSQSLEGCGQCATCNGSKSCDKCGS